MHRDPSAYLNNILKTAAPIEKATGSLKGETDGQSRLIRSAVEREIIIIGDAQTDDLPEDARPVRFQSGGQVDQRISEPSHA